jgi:hypothetical protein
MRREVRGVRRVGEQREERKTVRVEGRETEGETVKGEREREETVGEES